MQGPETRASLLASLNESASHEAWAEFTFVYRPLIVRVALTKGLQHADAEDLAQDVLAIVGQKIGEFDTSKKGSFRGWLDTITRNLVVNHLTRGKGSIGSGDSAIAALLQQVPDNSDATATAFDLELRRFQFQAAAEAVKNQISRPIWQAFWLTTVDRLSVSEVAERLGKSEGAIRMAKCRVMTRLREHAQKM